MLLQRWTLACKRCWHQSLRGWRLPVRPPWLPAPRYPTIGADGRLAVIVTFRRSGPLAEPKFDVLRSLGLVRGVHLQALPMVLVQATPAQVRSLARHPKVASVWSNQPVRLFNRQARELSGAALVSERPGDFQRAIPVVGRGVTILLNDSGVDTANPDIPLGQRVVDNVQGTLNFGATSVNDAAGSRFVPVVHVRNQINTDIGEGHGTHISGTLVGSGLGSAGRYKGVATGADLVSYGSGVVLPLFDTLGGLDFALANQFAYRHPIRVTSNSWGSSDKTFSCLDPSNIATYELYKKGIISVFAAGNDGPGEGTQNPNSRTPWVISVGAGEKDGVLKRVSARGEPTFKAECVMPDGVKWTHVNEPTVVAPGVNIISTRTLQGALPGLFAQRDVAEIPPKHFPYYTISDGTSMAAPHVTGIVALLLEANPRLTPDEVRTILRTTATNMTARVAWEVGAGFVNAHAAVAMAQGLRRDYGRTVHSERGYLANAILQPGSGAETISVAFSPVGTPEVKTFEVGADVASVVARVDAGTNTNVAVGIVLVDPDGKEYRSSAALPGLRASVTASGPGRAGTWKLSASGLTSYSGTSLDPAGATNGYAPPQTMTVGIMRVMSGGFTGMSDMTGHPLRTTVESAVGLRLVDAKPGGSFKPDDLLTRAELAQYLMMGASIRQSLPLSGKPRVVHVAPGTALYAAVESVSSPGGALRDMVQRQAPVMPLVYGRFMPDSTVQRVDVAYALVQALALQSQASAVTGPITAPVDGQRVKLQDDADIPAAQRGHVQLALDLGLLAPHVVKGATTQVFFNPRAGISRGAYATLALQFANMYRSAQDPT
jgi:serine protease AprX